MELEFDSRGNLKPYNKIAIDIDDFERFFVQKINQSSTRNAIFKAYKNFINDFSLTITPHFTHWINGSFVTQKLNPNDIDFVIFIDYDLFLAKKDEINTFFAINEQNKNTFLDIYFLIQFPENHKDAFKSASDYAYWFEWFTKTATNRNKQRFSKGFIEIKI